MDTRGTAVGLAPRLPAPRLPALCLPALCLPALHVPAGPVRLASSAGSPEVGAAGVGVADRSVRVVEDTASRRLARVMARAVLGYALVLPVLSIFRYLGLPAEQVHGWLVAVALVAVPPQLLLVRWAMRARFDRVGLAVLVAVVVTTGGLAVLMGPAGWGQLYVPCALIATTVAPIRSVAVLVALMAVPGPLVVALGQPDYALYWTLGVPFAILPLALVVHLVRAVRELAAVREELARRAILRERLRIDGELRSTVGVMLAGAVADGERIERIIELDAPTAAGPLRELSASARQAFAQARRLVRGYREVSLHTELETARTLLAAVGIKVRLEPGGEPGVPGDDDRARDALRAEVARLLAAGRPAQPVVLAVGGDRLVLEAAEPGGDPMTDEPGAPR